MLYIVEYTQYSKGVQDTIGHQRHTTPKGVGFYFLIRRIMTDELYDGLAITPQTVEPTLDFCPEDELTLSELAEQNRALQAKLAKLTPKVSKKPAKKATAKAVVVETAEPFAPKKAKSFLKETDTEPNNKVIYALRSALQKCQTTGLIKPVTKDLKLPTFELVIKLVDNSHNKASALLTQLNKISGYGK